MEKQLWVGLNLIAKRNKTEKKGVFKVAAFEKRRAQQQKRKNKEKKKQSKRNQNKWGGSGTGSIQSNP